MGHSAADMVDYEVSFTSSGGRRQHDSLEPHREEVHHREVTEGDQEIADTE